MASAGAGAAKERVGVLAIALHNLAVEQEHTMQIEEALRSYGNASAVAEAYVGNDHAITATLRNAHELAFGRCLPPPRPQKPRPAAVQRQAALPSPNLSSRTERTKASMARHAQKMQA